MTWFAEVILTSNIRAQLLNLTTSISMARQAIHTLQGGNPRAPRRRSTRSEAGYPRDPREVIQTLQGRRSMRFNGSDPRVLRRRSTRSEGRYPRAPRETIQTIQGMRSRRFKGALSRGSREVMHLHPQSSSMRFKGALPRDAMEDDALQGKSTRFK